MSEVIIVLGGGITLDGKLYEETKKRLNKTIEVYNNLNKPIIVSGMCQYYYVNRIKKTEAQGMKEYLLKREIPESEIILEPFSRNTLENALYCKINILENKDWKNIIIVTSKSHIIRASNSFLNILGKEYTINMVSCE